MQRLYENHKVLTYPRTDSRYLTSDIVPTLKERLQACAVGPYRKAASRLAMGEIRADKSFVNNAKVSDHHAIIPTEQFVQPEHFSNEERKIYDLVVRRFLAVLSPACEYEETSLTGTIGGEIFRAKGNVILKAGWREIYDSDWQDPEADEDDGNFENDAADSLLPGSAAITFKEGADLTIDAVRTTEGRTRPPAYFTEGTLIAAMENPVRYMQRQDRTLARTLGETGGLGTVATRADIIEKLFAGFLMEKKGNEIHITSKGRQLLSLVPADLKSPELTAQWELRLKAIAQGKESDKKFMSEIEAYTRSLITQIKNSDGTFRHDNLTRHKCPRCGKFMLEVNGKHGKMLVCQDRECGYRKPFPAAPTPAARSATKKWNWSAKATPSGSSAPATQRETERFPGTEKERRKRRQQARRGRLYEKTGKRSECADQQRIRGSIQESEIIKADHRTAFTGRNDRPADSRSRRC